MDGPLPAFVAEARLGRLGTVSARGLPHVVPVCFALADDAVYIAIDEKPKHVRPERLRRVRNLLANPNVQLLIDRYDEDWGRLAFVQLSGMASLLAPSSAGAANLREHAAALALLRAKYSQYGAMDLESRPVIRIMIEHVVSWRANGATVE
jgi:coenzyme F420-0:L-glutamate ligase/coenzyme F420-1:gamma-L-glutamate ligase